MEQNTATIAGLKWVMVDRARLEGLIGTTSRSTPSTSFLLSRPGSPRPNYLRRWKDTSWPRANLWASTLGSEFPTVSSRLDVTLVADEWILGNRIVPADRNIALPREVL